MWPIKLKQVNVLNFVCFENNGERGDHAPASEARTSCGLLKRNQSIFSTHKILSAVK